MKSILLTTTALVAFAGAAAADGHASVTWGGDTDVSYNSLDGFEYNADLTVTGTAALSNGLTAGLSVGVNVVDEDCGDDDREAPFDGNEYVCWDGYELSLTSENAGVYFGDTAPAADMFDAVDGSHLGFADKTDHAGEFDAVLRGEATFGGVTAAMSYGVDIEDTTDPLQALQVAASADLGGISLSGAYQDEYVLGDALIGVAASTSVAGADITASYMSSGSDNSIGVAGSYPVGPVTVGGYYSLNDGADDDWGVSADYADGPIAVNAYYEVDGDALDADTDDVKEFGVEGSYDTGMGATVYAGFINFDDAGTTGSAYYVAGSYDLGGGASVLVSYGVDDDGFESDEIGANEYQEGTTVEVSFSF